MAEDGKPGKDPAPGKAEMLRLQALANKRNEALDTMGNAIKKQDEARRNIIDKMR